MNTGAMDFPLVVSARAVGRIFTGRRETSGGNIPIPEDMADYERNKADMYQTSGRSRSVVLWENARRCGL